MTAAGGIVEEGIIDGLLSSIIVTTGLALEVAVVAASAGLAILAGLRCGGAWNEPAEEVGTAGDGWGERIGVWEDTWLAGARLRFAMLILKEGPVRFPNPTLLACLAAYPATFLESVSWGRPGCCDDAVVAVVVFCGIEAGVAVEELGAVGRGGARIESSSCSAASDPSMRELRVRRVLVEVLVTEDSATALI